MTLKLLQQLLSVVSFVAKSSLSCTNGSDTYKLGSRNIERSVCERCHCLRNRLYASTGGLTCHTTQCPVPDCQNPTRKAGECCPVCGVCNGVQITNCPSDDVRVSLPASRDEVLYHFNPNTRDCSRQGRHITTTTTPSGDIYRWKDDKTGYDVTVIASAGTHSNKCSFKVIPVGKSSLFLSPLQLSNI